MNLMNLHYNFYYNVGSLFMLDFTWCLRCLNILLKKKEIENFKNNLVLFYFFSIKFIETLIYRELFKLILEYK